MLIILYQKIGNAVVPRTESLTKSCVVKTVSEPKLLHSLNLGTTKQFELRGWSTQSRLAPYKECLQDPYCKKRTCVQEPSLGPGLRPQPSGEGGGGAGATTHQKLYGHKLNKRDWQKHNERSKGPHWPHRTEGPQTGPQGLGPQESGVRTTGRGPEAPEVCTYMLYI